MSKQSELLKNTAIIAFGKICTQLISFLLLPLYTSVLSTSEYGTVDLVLTYSSLLMPIITLALEQSVFRYLIDVRDDKKKSSEYISVCVFTTFITLLIFILIMGLVYYKTQNSLFIYFSLVLIASAFSSLFLQVCRGLGDNIGYSIGGVITAITQIAFNIILLVYVKLGAQGMMLANFFGNIACAIYLYIRCKLYDYLKVSYFNKTTFKEMIHYSAPLIPNQLSWWILNASDKVIVQFFIGLSGNGILTVANKFPSVYQQFNGVFNISWTESSSIHINDEDAESFFTKTINSSVTLFMCLCVGIIVCLPFVFPIMVNSAYNEAYGLIPILMVATFFNVLVSLYGVIYVAYKDTVEIMKTAIFAASINIITHLALIKFVGLYAAAISTMCGFGFMAIYRYYHSRRYLTVKLDKKVMTIGLIMSIVAFISYYSNNLLLQVLAFLFVLIVSIKLNIHLIRPIIDKIRHKEDNPSINLANKPIKTYASVLKDTDIRMNSSSGGIFYALAKYILDKKGKVYGVSMSSDCRRAEYISIDNIKDIYKLQGSKYIQAYMSDTFKQVKSDLNNGLNVLFTGTGCQINGLKNFLGKDYDNLLCVDVICHGTPSPKVWREYVDYQEEINKGSLIYTNFRCKDDSWESFGVKEVLNTYDSSELSRLYIPKDEDRYMKLFLNNYDLRESCYRCRAKDIKKSDITIADFWGIDDVYPDINDHKGVSLVLIRTSKGLDTYNSISETLISKEVTYEEGIKANPSEYKSAIRPSQRDTFFKDLNSLGFYDTSLKYLKVSFKHKIKMTIKSIYSPILNMIRGGQTDKYDYGILLK